MASSSASQLHTRLSILTACLKLSSYAFAGFVVASYAVNFHEMNEVQFKLDVDYVKWVTELPAYSVCPVPRKSFILRQLRRVTNASSSSSGEIVAFAKSMIRPKRLYCPHCTAEEVKKTFRGDLRAFTEFLSERCEDILLHCSWNGRPFPCCRHFQRIPTAGGFCFSLNSAHSREPELVPGHMTTSVRHPTAELAVEMSAAVRVHVHDGKALDFASRVPVRKVRPGQEAEITYRIVEHAEDPSAWYLSMRERNCSLAGERRIGGLKVYCRSGCRMRCDAVRQVRMCGCKHHLLPGSEPDCDVEGLSCLDDDRRNNPAEGDECDCLEECSTLEVAYTRYGISDSDSKTSKAVVVLSGPPTERVILTARLTPINVIVTFACASRLITSKSIHQLVREGFAAGRVLCATEGPKRLETDKVETKKLV